MTPPRESRDRPEPCPPEPLLPNSVTHLDLDIQPRGPDRRSFEAVGREQILLDTVGIGTEFSYRFPHPLQRTQNRRRVQPQCGAKLAEELLHEEQASGKSGRAQDNRRTDAKHRFTINDPKRILHGGCRTMHSRRGSPKEIILSLQLCRERSISNGFRMPLPTKTCAVLSDGLLKFLAAIAKQLLLPMARSLQHLPRQERLDRIPSGRQLSPNQRMTHEPSPIRRLP